MPLMPTTLPPAMMMDEAGIGSKMLDGQLAVVIFATNEALDALAPHRPRMQTFIENRSLIERIASDLYDAHRNLSGRKVMVTSEDLNI